MICQVLSSGHCDFDLSHQILKKVYLSGICQIVTHFLFFLRVVMLHIKLMGAGDRTPCKLIISIHTPQTPGVESKFKTFFTERSHVAYRIKKAGDTSDSRNSSLT